MTALTNQIAKGWCNGEEGLLWQEVEKARTEGRTLKTVFDIVAITTGRKPNSIRNYYYSTIKQSPLGATRYEAFVPFSKQEIHDLLVRVLSDRAKGISVRACTMKMALGDTKLMLRYQNKYRSLLKTDKESVMQVVEEMRLEGIDCIDPFDNSSRSNLGRPSKVGNAELLRSIIDFTALCDDIAALKARITNVESTLCIN